MKEYRSDNVAVIDRGDGRGDMLAVSQIPLRVPGGPDGRRPLDLTLEEDRAGLAPVSPMVPLHFEQSLSDGIALGRDWVRVFFESDAEPETSPEISLLEQKAYYHGAARDTDFMATPTPRGVETFTLLRSVESPQAHTLRFDLPAGIELRPTPEGGAALWEGQTLRVRIHPPSAVDAQDQPVPVSYQVDGHRLRVVVRHRELDAAYPILVDPVIDFGGAWTVVENWVSVPGGAWVHNPSLDRDGWRYRSYVPGYGMSYDANWPFRFCTPYMCENTQNGLWAISWDYGSYPMNSWAQWYYPAWGDVYIPRAEFAHMNKYSPNDPFDGTYLQAAILSPEGRHLAYQEWWWTPPAVPGESFNYYTAQASSNDWMQGTLASYLFAYGINHTSAYRWTWSYLGGAIVYLQDRSAPAMVGVWSDSQTNVVGPGGTQIHARASDAGLGVASFAMQVDNGSVQWRHHGCAGVGDRKKRCPADAYSDQFGTSSFTVDTSGWTPGSQHSVRVSAIDVLGKWSEPWTLTLTYAGQAGDVYFAAEYIGDPTQGGTLEAFEWGKVGTQTGRRVEADVVTTRDDVPCGVSRCAEVRMRSRNSETESGSPDTYTLYRGTSVDDERLPMVTSIMSRPDRGGTLAGSGPLSEVLGPWQTAPPGTNGRYQLYEAGATIDFGQAVDTETGELEQLALAAVVSRVWVDEITRMPLKAEVDSGSTEPSDVVYWTYDPVLRKSNELPGDFFAVPAPANPALLKTVVLKGSGAVGAQVDAETRASFSPYSLGDRATVGTAEYCLATSLVEHLQEPGNEEPTDPDVQDGIPGPYPDDTVVRAVYNPASDGCAPGEGSLDAPTLELRSAATGSTRAQTWRRAYAEESGSGGAGTRGETVIASHGGDQVSVQVVPLDEETGYSGALTQIGETTVLLTGTFDSAAARTAVSTMEVR